MLSSSLFVLSLFGAAVASPVLVERAAPLNRGVYTKYTINPSNNSPPKFSANDAPFSVSEATLYSNIICHPGNNSNVTISPSSVKKPFLLVPGTGATGPEAFDQGYVILLGNLGYQPCTISPPPYMLGDLQVLSNYVAYAVVALSSASGAQVPIISWSAGGPTSQWALTFFYSARGNTKQFIPFAADFKGTTVSAGLNATTNPSVHQQTVGSRFLAVIAKKARCTWVPTTSIFSNSDEVVQPEYSPGTDQRSTSYIGQSSFAPASNIVVQEHCPLELVYDHGEQIWNSFTVVAALKASNLVAPSNFAADCSMLAAPGLTPLQATALESSQLVDLARIVDPQYFTPSEPATASYVSSFPDVSC